jgi:hypothetical protein
MSKRRSRLKWGCFSLTMLFIALWALSLVVYAFHRGSSWYLRMDFGLIFYTYHAGSAERVKEIMSLYRPAPSTHGWPTGWGYLSQFPRPATWRQWYPHYTFQETNAFFISPPPELPFTKPGTITIINVWAPFWIFVLLTGIPTTYLFLKDRRYKKIGHCGGCGYNLKDNESGRCPECGKVFAIQSIPVPEV